MAEPEILSMYVLTPMWVQYALSNAQDEREQHEEIFLIDPVDDRIFRPSGELVVGPLYQAVMTIVRRQKNPVQFLTEEQVAELIRQKTEESAHARTVKS